VAFGERLKMAAKTVDTYVSSNLAKQQMHGIGR
jgi:hypothetical protein